MRNYCSLQSLLVTFYPTDISEYLRRLQLRCQPGYHSPHGFTAEDLLHSYFMQLWAGFGFLQDGGQRPPLNCSHKELPWRISECRSWLISESNHVTEPRRTRPILLSAHWFLNTQGTRSCSFVSPMAHNLSRHQFINKFFYRNWQMHICFSSVVGVPTDLTMLFLDLKSKGDMVLFQP